MANKKDEVDHSGLERRVTAIEAELTALRGTISEMRTVSPQGWKFAIEKYAGDEDLQSIFREAMKLREADRKQARRRRRTSPKAKR